MRSLLRYHSNAVELLPWADVTERCWNSPVDRLDFVGICPLQVYCSNYGNPFLSDQMVATMATSMPNLIFVDLSWNSGLTSVGVGALMSNCSRLEEAILSGLKALTSKPFLAIIGDLPRWRAKQEVMLRRRFKSQQNGGPVETLIKPCSMVC